MPDRRPSLPDLDRDLVGARLDRAGRQRIALEVLAVHCLAFFPELAASIFSLRRPAQIRQFVDEDSVALILRSLAVTLPVVVLIRYSREPLAKFGCVRPRPLHLLVGGLGLSGVVYCLWMLAWDTTWLSQLELRPRDLTPKGSGSIALLVVALAMNAVAEEVVARGYLIPRLEDLTHHAGASVVVSSMLFASYHLYQGPAGAIHALIFGLVFGLVFSITRTIGPLIAGHFMYGLWAEFG